MMGIPQCVGPCQFNKLQAEIDRLKVELELSGSNEVRLEAEIDRLEELLRGVGANRYWEGRWRDADAENQKLRAALLKYGDHAHECASRRWSDRYCNCGWTEPARKALAKERK